MKIACVSSLFYKLQIPENKTDFRDDFFFFFGEGRGLCQKSTHKGEKHVFINILYYVSEKPHNSLNYSMKIL